MHRLAVFAFDATFASIRLGWRTLGAHPVLAGIYLFTYAILYGLALSSFGAQDVVWRSSPLTSGISITLLFALMVFIQFLLDGGETLANPFRPREYYLYFTVLTALTVVPAFRGEDLIEVTDLGVNTLALDEVRMVWLPEGRGQYLWGVGIGVIAFRFIRSAMFQLTIWVFRAEQDRQFGMLPEHLMALILFLSLVGMFWLSYLVSSWCNAGDWSGIPPAAAVCLILGIAVTVHAYVLFHWGRHPEMYAIVGAIPIFLLLTKYQVNELLSAVVASAIVGYFAWTEYTKPGHVRRRFVRVFAAVLVGVPAIFFLGRDSRRNEHRITCLAECFEEPHDRPNLEKYEGMRSTPGLVDSKKALDAWSAQQHLWREQQYSSTAMALMAGWVVEHEITARTYLPPLIVVAVSGGASSSAIFTANFLLDLEIDHPNFLRNVRVITGASGGMVGAAYIVALMHQDPLIWNNKFKDVRTKKTALEQATLRINREVESGVKSKPAAAEELRKLQQEYVRLKRDVKTELLRNLAGDFLSPVVRQWVFHDIMAGFLQRSTNWDRSMALEKAWEKQLNKTLSVTFSGPNEKFPSLAESEAAGTVPSLIFSPMMVEDGRRCLISNLDLDKLIETKVRTATGERTQRYADRRASVSAVEMFKLFPQARSSFPLATAARLSATFPFVTPSATLPTRPARRLVDAGYYDNYGISLAAAWLLHHQDWITDSIRSHRISRVLLIQLRAYANQTARDEWVSEPEKNPDRAQDGELPAIGGAPIAGLFSARQASMFFRNDEQIQILSRLFNADQVIRGFFGTYTESDPNRFLSLTAECPEETSLTWYLSQSDLSKIYGSTDWVTFAALQRHEALNAPQVASVNLPNVTSAVAASSGGDAKKRFNVQYVIETGAGSQPVNASFQRTVKSNAQVWDALGGTRDVRSVGEVKATLLKEP